MEQKTRTRQRLSTLRRHQTLGLEAKIRYAERLIEAALLAKRPIVCWSGGKDSTVLLHLVRQFAPNINVTFNDTGVELQETRGVIKGVTSCVCFTGRK